VSNAQTFSGAHQYVYASETAAAVPLPVPSGDWVPLDFSGAVAVSGGGDDDDNDDVSGGSGGVARLHRVRFRYFAFPYFDIRQVRDSWCS
jgi:hypothetical protein